MESASTFRDWILVDFVSISSQENLFNIRLTLFMFTSRNHSKCLTIAMHSKHEQFSVLPSLLNSLGVSSHCQKGSSLESLKFSKGIWVVRRRTDCSFFGMAVICSLPSEHVLRTASSCSSGWPQCFTREIRGTLAFSQIREWSAGPIHWLHDLLPAKYK